jgi:protein TonB
VAARAAPAERTGDDGGTSDAAEEGSAPVSPDLQRIYTRWDTAPRLLDHTRPDYPPIARKAGVDGTVTLHVVIGVDGKVEEVKVATSSPKFIFDEAAAAAVRNWRYEPALIDGHPVRAKVSQTVQFTLGGR